MIDFRELVGTIRKPKSNKNKKKNKIKSKHNNFYFITH